MDDIDPALNTKNATYTALERICLGSDLTIYQNATSLSMNLEQLYAATSLIGGREVFGSKTAFSKRYVKKEPVYVYNKKKKSRTRVYKATGYHNVADFKSKFHPMNIRFTYEDLVDDLSIPALITERVYLDMYPLQRTKYQELQKGVRTIINSKTMATKTKSINALAAFTIGSQICSGTFALKTSDGGYEKDVPESSAKLDWIMDKLKGEWKDEKIVVYSKFRGSIRALQDRLDAVGIGYSTIWGVETDPQVRQQEMDNFWEDPQTKVMIISVSGERSLNLQNASILVMWDMVLNPARVMQLAGRVRRVGSKHKTVFVFELLHNDTQEERYMDALSTRQALFDFVYDVSDEDGDDPDKALIEKLDADQLLQLITP
jgi:SNF2 family DNA or RNA helicase